MNYVHADLGTLNAGATVTVALAGNACNVALVDTMNLGRYRRGESFRHVGGHYRQSPAVLRVPTHGHWHVVADLAGRAGRLGLRVISVRP